MQLAIYQNSESGRPGLIDAYVAQRGWSATVIKADALPGLRARPQADAHIFLGSPCSVNDVHLPWIACQRRLVRSLLQDEVPLFGICFGAQLIAAETGGAVGPMARRRRGWMVNTQALDAVWHGPWLRWHEEAVTLPPAATVIARDEAAIQAFRWGQSIGVQFHPEVDAAVLRAWSKHPYFAEETSRSILADAIEVAEARAAEIQYRAFALFESIFSMLT